MTEMNASRRPKKTRRGLAHIEQTPEGEYRYVCECHPIEGGWTLPECYAAMQTGRHPWRHTGDEVAYWQERLLRDAGILK
jgi:hypothetical protein